MINPELKNAPIINSEGYGLSHYAANSRMMGVNQSVNLSASNKLLIGEINSGFLPWGHPLNMRDPCNGINKSNRGFGGPAHRKGAMFLLNDGSIKVISEDIALRYCEK